MVPSQSSSMQVPIQGPGGGMVPRFNGLFPGIQAGSHGGGQLGTFGQGIPGGPLSLGSNHQLLQQQQQTPLHQTNHGLQPSLQHAMSPHIQNQSVITAIREVWASNFEQEMHVIRELIERFNYISVESEFPGIVARPIGSFKTTTDYHYQTLRCNVDLLHVIQLGITFADAHGHRPEGLPSTWQFNFKYNLNEEMYQSEMIDLLTKSGVDFKRHEEFGIDPFAFAELFVTSGLVIDDSVTWISYHSGYDFGYLVALMLNSSLPAEETEFVELVKIFFPSLYDVKLMTKAATGKPAKGTLQDLAEELRVPRVGPAHHAGSEALLVNSCYFELAKVIRSADVTDDSFHNQMWGLV
ncbi:ribonuclease H-like domain-containing protein [Lipomyces arxii]|uniref:ribonuclease H-like domain-containing protein n=1 Tax=Lipomyces arxii TaxID=56418 RepID=UPI0034CD2549